MSRLFKEVITEVKKNILPVFNMNILLKVLQSVPFTDETRGTEITETLSKLMNEELYGKGVKCSEIAKKLRKLNEFY